MATAKIVSTLIVNTKAKLNATLHCNSIAISLTANLDLKFTPEASFQQHPCDVSVELHESLEVVLHFTSWSADTASENFKI